MVINFYQKETIMKTSSLSGENFGALMISYSEIGGHMLTLFLGTSQDSQWNLIDSQGGVVPSR